MSPVTHTQSVHITRLQVHPANRRDDLGDLTELADSIRIHGLLNPLTVCKHPSLLGHFYVMAGQRRLAAAKLARVSELPVSVRPAAVIGNAKALEVFLVENCQRKNTTPMETARAMGELRDECFYSVGKIAHVTGLSASTVSYHLMLLDADEATQARVMAGQVTAGAVREAVKEHRARNRYGPAKSRKKVAVVPPHFGKTHPMADEVRAMCSHLDRRLPGLVGCGECWERAIRRDAIEGALSAPPAGPERVANGRVAPAMFVPPASTSASQAWAHASAIGPGPDAMEMAELAGDL